MSWLIIVLKIFLGLVVIGVVAIGIFYYSANKAAKAKSRMIDELAKVPIGSSVEETIQLAKSLGFNFGDTEFAIPHVVEMKNSDDPQNERALPTPVTKDADLSNFKNGTLNFGLSLFLFERKGCDINFKDGKVQATRIWFLD